MVNKIVGALVILALIILISPLVFTHHSKTFLLETIKEPPFPERLAQNDTLNALKALKDLAHDESLDKAKDSLLPYPLFKTHLALAQVKHAHTNNKAWVIQVGHFKNKTDAFHLANRLRIRGYNAFIHQKNAAFGEETTVYIGPERERDAAEVLSLRLAKEDRVSGIIKSFKPLANS